jgi:hypothetical protein
LLLRYWVEARSNKKEGRRKKEERFSYRRERREDFTLTYSSTSVFWLTSQPFKKGRRQKEAGKNLPASCSCAGFLRASESQA